MYAQVEKPKEHKSRAVANSATQKKGNGKQGFGFVDNRPKAVAQPKVPTIITSGSSKNIVQRQVGDSHTGLVCDREDGVYIKIIGSDQEYKVVPAHIVNVTGTYIAFTEGEDQTATDIHTIEGKAPERQVPNKMPDTPISGSFDYRDMIRGLLNNGQKNVAKNEPRFMYDPEKGISIGQVMTDTQNSLPSFRREARKVNDDTWEMKTVEANGGGQHQWKPADGVYDFVLSSPNGSLQMINRQQGGAGHSSFGSSHLMAGEVKFHNGQLIEWSTRSGHFKPPVELALQTPLDKRKLIGYEGLKGPKNEQTKIESVEESSTVLPSRNWEDDASKLIDVIRERDAQAITKVRSEARKPDIAEQSYILNTTDIKQFLAQEAQAGNKISNNAMKKLM
jgi:hypothetical protein